MSIKEIMQKNSDEADGIYVYLDFQDVSDTDPVCDIRWEGWLENIPAKYHDMEVTRIGKSLRDMQNGKAGYYLYIGN